MAGSVEFILYHYKPSLAAAVVFIVLFLGSGVHHFVTLIRRRSWYFIPFLIGCLFEGVGYIGRAIASTQAPDYTVPPYVMQSLLILLGPIFFAATIYMVLSRLIIALDGHEYALVKPRYLTAFFVAGDVLSFLAQSAGGGIMADADNMKDWNNGQKAILGGLGIQVLWFGFFIVAIIVFHVRITQRPTSSSATTRMPWRQLIMVLYVTSLLILVRNIFRIIQYAQGYDGSLQKSEAWLYGFDSALMFVVTASFNLFHPSRVLRGKVMTTDATASSSIDQAESYPMKQTRRHHHHHHHSEHSAEGGLAHE